MLADTAATADAYMAWWSLAGVDCAVGEEPVNWLRPKAPAAGPAAAAAMTSVSPAVERPATIEAFRDWLAHDMAQPERRWPGAAILPAGDLHAPLMIVTDMPDPVDMAAGSLFAERAGQLFDAMLRALGLNRDAIHLASLFLSRPPGGMVEAADLSAAADRMRSHVSLAAPRRLLLLGDRTSRSLLSPDMADRDGLRVFNHDGGNVPVVATFHPRLLLSQPAAKAECWRALQSLIEETNT